MKKYTTPELREMLSWSFEKRLEMSKQIIRDALKEAKYPIVQFSGGGDSCLLAWLVNQVDPTVPMAFNDWGLFLDRQLDFCKKFFKKYNMKYYVSKSGTNYKEFLTKKGFPIFKGFRPFITPKDFDKHGMTGSCRSLRKKCWRNLLKQYPADLYFVGILADESPQRKSLFVQYGFWSQKDDGIMVKPIELITKAEVFELMDKNDILYPKEYYQDVFDGEILKFKHCDLGCFMCGERFKEKGWGRIGRLAREDNELFKEIMDLGMRNTLHSVIEDNPNKTDYIIEFLRRYDNDDRKIAYDFDGVLMPAIKRDKKYFQQNKYERDLFERKKRYHFKASGVLKRPIEKEYYIISARRERYRDITEEWLKKNKIEPIELILMEGQLTFNRIIEHKSKYLKELGIEKYYEDDPKIVAKIRKLLPNIEVIQIPKVVVTQGDITIPDDYQMTLGI